MTSYLRIVENYSLPLLDAISLESRGWPCRLHLQVCFIFLTVSGGFCVPSMWQLRSYHCFSLHVVPSTAQTSIHLSLRKILDLGCGSAKNPFQISPRPQAPGVRMLIFVRDTTPPTKMSPEDDALWQLFPLRDALRHVWHGMEGNDLSGDRIKHLRSSSATKYC